MSYENPKLRPVQPHLIEHNGRPAIVLRDPLQLTSEVMVMPQELGPLLALCDGSRDVKALRANSTSMGISPPNRIVAGRRPAIAAASVTVGCSPPRA